MSTTTTPTTTIRIPTPLRAYTDDEAAVDVHGSTVGEALHDLVTTHPQLKAHLYTEDDALRSFVNVYLGDEDIRYLDGTDTPVSEGDELSIVPSIAGGCL